MEKRTSDREGKRRAGFLSRKTLADKVAVIISSVTGESILKRRVNRCTVVCLSLLSMAEVAHYDQLVECRVNCL